MRRKATDRPSASRGTAVVLAVAVGAVSVATARHNPDESLAGDSLAAQIAELVAGWLLVVVGLTHRARYRRNRFAMLVVAAGIAWCLPEWVNPGVDSGLVFTAGLLGAAACPPLLLHAALTYPDRRLTSRLERGSVALAYVGALLVLGLLPALVFAPVAQGCFECPRNLLLVHADAGLYSALLRWGARLGLVWSVALLLAVVRRLVASGAVRAVVAPVLLPAGAFIALVALEFAHSLGGDVLGTAGFDRRVSNAEAVTLMVFGGGIAWGLFRGSRARSTVAQLIVELGRAPRPGGVRDALAQALGEPSLALAYVRDAGRTLVDAQGGPVEVTADEERAQTPILRDGEPFAVLVHDATLLGDTDLVEEAVAAARLAIDNEQFQATVFAQVEDLRRSQARIIERGDAERQRLERDLHDGAQQRILGLSMTLQILRRRAGEDLDAELQRRLEDAEGELQAAHAELREIAHGMHPALLSTEGLAAAVEALAERSAVPMVVRRLPHDRLAPAVEAAAYFAVAEAVRNAPGGVGVDLHRDDDCLVGVVEGLSAADVDIDGADWLVEVADRVGAIGGRIVVSRDHDASVLRVEVPCG